MRVGKKNRPKNQPTISFIVIFSNTKNAYKASLTLCIEHFFSPYGMLNKISRTITLNVKYS